MNDEFQRQAVAVFQQWDSDLDKTKDQEEKLAVRLFVALFYLWRLLDFLQKQSHNVNYL